MDTACDTEDYSEPSTEHPNYNLQSLWRGKPSKKKHLFHITPVYSNCTYGKQMCCAEHTGTLNCIVFSKGSCHVYREHM